MIRFNLICETDHEFDGWFSSSDDFDVQKKRGLIACPICDSTNVSKSLMVPAVSTSRRKEKVIVANMDSARREMVSEMKKIRDKIIEGSEDVGRRFSEEARKIHYGESEERGIYGEASRDEVEGLLDEGVAIAPLPVLPEDAN